LVAQPLLKTRQETNDELLNKALQFLLKAKDRYGVWYSTQATVNVLDALILALATENNNSQTIQPKAAIYLNGNKLQEITLPKPNEIANPVFINLPNLNPSNNRVEIRQNGVSSYTMAQIVANHYVGWANAKNLNFSSNDSRGLSLKVTFDRTTAKIGEEITCSVEVERVGFQGYGMLLAEIGLPPGADVSRESLEKARETNWNFSRYDVLPDRIVVYLWATAGGNKFTFKFKPRYGLEANKAVSTVYDYYNAEANATVAPTGFMVR
jgi:hypothetical protein